MIKFENTKVHGLEAAVRGMRNPLNSWFKSDSGYDLDEYMELEYKIGPNDLDLCRRLIKSGPEHRKFMRQIQVWVDITAPTYWIAEHDTYKVGTTRNSCSFMHKGVSKPFTIEDFSTSDEIQEILKPNEKKGSVLKYPYETDEYKTHTLESGRTYRVYRNSKVVSEEYQTEETMPSGHKRIRTFKEREVQPSQTPNGYFALHLGDRSCIEKWQLHRLVAHVWIDNPDDLATVDHLDGDKGNNCVENLEWVSRSKNGIRGWKSGVMRDASSLRNRYASWKAGHICLDPFEKHRMKKRYDGHNASELSEEYGLTKRQFFGLIHQKPHEDEALFHEALTWERVINELNRLRELYLDTNDTRYFEVIRRLLPSGYNQKYTWSANYETILTMARQRRGHKLTEWDDFIKWAEELPYMKEFMECCS